MTSRLWASVLPSENQNQLLTKVFSKSEALCSRASGGVKSLQSSPDRRVFIPLTFLTHLWAQVEIPAVLCGCVMRVFPDMTWKQPRCVGFLTHS